MATYYVSTTGSNGNTGLSILQPWGTLQYAFNQIRAGDTLYMRGGTYPQTAALTIPSSASGSSPSAKTTIKSYPGETAVIDGQYIAPGGANIFASNPYVVQTSSTTWTLTTGYQGSGPNIIYSVSWERLVIVRASNILLENFVVERSRGSGIGSHDTPTSGVHYKGLTIRHIRDTGTRNYLATSPLWENCIIHDIGIFAAFARSAAYLNWGGATGGDGTSTGVHYKNCTIYDAWGEGFYTSPSGGIVENCTAYRIWRPYVYMERTDNQVVRNCLLYYDNTGPGGVPLGYPPQLLNITVEPAPTSFGSKTTADNNTMYNNLCIGAACWSSHNNNKWINNTFINSNFGFYGGSGDFKNNIVLNSTCLSATGTYSRSNNLYWPSRGSYPAGVADVIANPNLQNVGATVIPPSASNYKLLTGSAAINAGAAV